MKKIIVLIFLFLTANVFADEAYFLSNPAPSPDGSKIVFVYDGDLWTVSVKGGIAYRLTAMDGEESNPVYSPDGEWIAFTGSQDGNPNVYIIPVDGGKIVQLTYNDANDYVESWSWDSKYIYFNSNRENIITSFKVPVNGGTPSRLFADYRNIQHNIAEHPATKEIFFNETWESSRFTQRKKYKGAYNPDIQSYNFATKEYKEYTNYPGKDMWPTIDKNGTVFFVSDEGNDEYNLYMLDNGTKKQLTEFDTSIKRPRVSAEGNIILFEKDYQIYSYDVKTTKSSKVPIEVFVNKTLTLEQELQVDGKITYFDVSPDGKKIVFVSRGSLFVSDIEGKFVRLIGTNKQERVMQVFWLSDNETVIYSRTVNGWLNLFMLKVTDSGSEKQLTFDKSNNLELTLNKAKTKGVYQNGYSELKVIDLKSMKSEVIVKDEFWAIYPVESYFSPDDRYIAYAAIRDYENDIFFYDTESKKSIQITKTGVPETSPYWSPDGKYLYFVTDLFNPFFPRGAQNIDIYRIPLTKIDKEFKIDEYNKLFEKEDKNKKKDSAKVTVKIDFADLAERWEKIIDNEGNQYLVSVFQKGDETTLLFTSSHDGERRSLWKSTLKPFEKPDTKKIGGVSSEGFYAVESKNNYYVLAAGSLHKLNLGAGKLDKITIDYQFTKNLADEFGQMFFELWANIKENFYDENFHGVDWNLMLERYKKYVPYLNSRKDLRVLSEDMLGELNASHLGFTSYGDEERTFYKNRTITTGVVFNNDRPYEVERIVKNSPADKEGKNIAKGDVLTAVNGTAVDPKVNREYYFTGPFTEKEVVLTFKRGKDSFETKIHPVNRAAFENLLAKEWVDNNQKYVDEKTKEKIAYVYMPDMETGSLEIFLKDMIGEAKYRDALILDLRYNRGGNVHDAVLNFLSQRPYLEWKYRGGRISPQPSFAPSGKPMVLLLNEQSLSDAEMTAAGFRELKLGKIIGTETYRWIIFTSGKTLVDGSYYRLPAWGCYNFKGDDLEMTGVAPDIYVKQTMKDKLEKKDPQLDRAIEELTKQLKK